MEIERIEFEKKEFLDNLDKYKNKIKKDDLLSIGSWDSYKKKSNFKSNYKINKIIEEPFLLKIFQISNMINNIKNTLKNVVYIKKLFLCKSWNYSDVEKKFTKIQLNKIRSIAKNRYFNKNKVLYFLLDVRRLKTRITIMNNKKCIITYSNGLTFKKLKLKNKKNKKSERTTNLLIKSLDNKKKYFIGFKKIILYVKGVKKYLENIIKYLCKNSLNGCNVTIIFDNKFSKNSYFCFKKIKAIKRKLKKKLVKLK